MVPTGHLACPACPACHVGTVELVTDGQVGEAYVDGFYLVGTVLPLRLVSKPFGACNRCEFVIEIDTRN